MRERRAAVIGAGLAGAEAADRLTRYGIRVDLYEMKPVNRSPAHTGDGFAELVCSNSLRSDRLTNAVGLLKEEMRLMHSLVMEAADLARVPAGGALAVDRETFSGHITKSLREHPLVEVVSGEVTEIPDGPVIIATGPLTSDALSETISRLPGLKTLNFYDAAAPIVTAESLNMDKVFRQSRYDRGDDYLNCPMTEEEYNAFVDALLAAETADIHGFEETKVFEGCMPVESMARRGRMVLAFGPMKPVGLRDPKTGKEPYAVVQLRRDNAEGSIYNLVGFQTRLKWGEQKRVFSMIPGLEHAEFIRYGVMHRNTFLESPAVLTKGLYLKEHPNVFFAGQITGFEGYMESAASGLLAARNLYARLQGRELPPPPTTTMCGALIDYITTPNKDFQPMGANMGILPRTEEIDTIRDKRERYMALSDAAQAAMRAWAAEAEH